MPSINKCIIFFSLALSACALTTPHDVRHVHHRAVAAHIASPQELVGSGGTGEGKTLRRRTNNSSRCNKKNSGPQAAAVKAAPSTSPTTTTTTTTTSHAIAHHPTPSNSTPAAPKASPHSASGGSGSTVGSFMAGTQTGQGTFYGTGLGACGITNNDGQYIAAVSHLLFDAFPGYNGVNPNKNPICGRQVTATYQGKSVTVTLTDRCAACKLTDLDFSPAAFNAIADPSVGRISGMTWTWS